VTELPLLAKLVIVSLPLAALVTMFWVSMRDHKRRTDALVARIKSRPVVARYRQNGVEVVVHGFPRER
jgi:hypothetical protein